MPIIYLAALAALLCVGSVRAQQKPWPIRAVIVTTFEVGNDTGDAPGEFSSGGARAPR